MSQFNTLFLFGLKRRGKDFFVLFYNIVFPTIIILLLGYLTSPSYGTTFTSYHYYTIVMIPFCALMGITTVSYAAQDEKLLHTAYRYMAAPISKREIVLSKFASSVIVLSICNSVTLLIAMLMFGLNFHSNIFRVIWLLICETISVTGIGLYLGLACKNLDALRNFLNIPMVIFGFLGGAFFPVSSFNPILAFIINLSPLTWINRGIIACVYDNQTQTIEFISGGLLIMGLIMTALTIRFFKKEAFI
ncbi:ABC transporter permease [Paenibacillus sp. CAA11]|uniref:ABC transporter permease n=1 Tax=Paenibacillus sp. CAA11 TaxID=1532905 RepID=UPI000D375D7E|nr:ABC transporter permease [Paenibacillus sp. CAA11]AWB43567.1 ABC transporter permease [Paenibacillus sp. CAA11]